MATANKLNSEAFNRLYDEMGKHISSQSEQMYRANNCKAGQYCGSWYYFREAWLNDKVYNLEVYQALESGYPPIQFEPIN